MSDTCESLPAPCAFPAMQPSADERCRQYLLSCSVALSADTESGECEHGMAGDCMARREPSAFEIGQRRTSTGIGTRTRGAQGLLHTAESSEVELRYDMSQSL